MHKHVNTMKNLTEWEILLSDFSPFKVVLKKALTSKDNPTVIVVPIDYSENMKLFTDYSSSSDNIGEWVERLGA